MHRYLSLAKIAVIALSALILQACSAAKIAYEQAPTVLSWQINRYLDLDSRQDARLRGDLEEFQRWHRTTQLPVYAAFLAKNRPRLADDFSKAQACAALSEAKTHLQPSLEQLESMGQWLLPDLSGKQLAYLEKRLAASNADWRDEWLDASAEDRKAARFKQVLSRSEFLYGELRAEQKKAVESMLEKSLFDAQKSYDLRLARQSEMLGILRHASLAPAAPDRRKTSAFVRGLLANDPENVGPYQAALRDEGCALFADIHNMTTPAQRARAVAMVKAYEEDLAGLAARG